LNNLSPDKYHPHDILITKDGLWHMMGVAMEPSNILRQIDVAVNAMHGEYGEDGKVQQLLEAHGTPFTGSKSFPSAMAMNKGISKKFFLKHGLKTPIHVFVHKKDDIEERAIQIFKTFPQPSIVKPATGGSSVGVRVARTLRELKEALYEALGYSSMALVEEFINGREATCGVIDNFRGKKHYPLLPVEIIKPAKSDFFDFDAKYSGQSDEVCPGNFTQEESEQLQRLAMIAHECLGLRHYSRSDFLLTPRRGIYILEVNTLPGLTEESLFPKSLYAVGSSLSNFLDHLISLALEKPGN